jgi:quinol monooxygenase YgiN
MLIVAGHFDVDPAQRDEFLAGRVDAIRTTRTEGGCLEYVMSADPADPTRVMLFERWADQAAFDAHMEAIKTAARPSGPAPKGFSVKIYDIAGERSFG